MFARPLTQFQAMATDSDLRQQRCEACEGGVPPLDSAAINAHHAELNARWRVSTDEKWLIADLQFANFYEVMAFANAVAFIANRENHHPDLTLSYRDCELRYTTHAVGGLTKNDFICAAKIDALLD